MTLFHSQTARAVGRLSRSFLLATLSLTVVGLASCDSAEENEAADSGPKNSSRTKKTKPDQSQPQLAPVASSIRQATIYTHAVKTIEFDPTATRLAAGDGGGSVRLWKVADGQLERAVLAHGNGAKVEWVFSVAFSPDGQQLATGGGDNLIRIWDITSGELKQELKGHTDDLHGVAFTPDGKRLVSGGDDKTVRVWDLVSGEAKVLQGHTRQVTGVATSPDRKHAASSSRDGTVRLWALESGETIHTLSGHEEDVTSVQFNSDGSELISTSRDKTARTWDVATGKQRHSYGGHEGWVFTATFLSDQNIATGSGDKKLRFWKPDAKEPHQVLDLGADISSLDYAPNQQLLAVAMTDSTVQLFDVSGVKPKQAKLLGTPAQLSPLSTELTDLPGLEGPLSPDTYLLLLFQVRGAVNDEWKQAVAILEDHGDGFALKTLEDVDRSKLNAEDAGLLDRAIAKIGDRLSRRDAQQIAAEIETMLTRAATADIGCNSLEGQIVVWASESLQPHLAEPAIRQELERIADLNHTKKEPRQKAIQRRISEYAKRLLKGEDTKAKR